MPLTELTPSNVQSGHMFSISSFCRVVSEKPWIRNKTVDIDMRLHFISEMTYSKGSIQSMQDRKINRINAKMLESWYKLVAFNIVDREM